MNLPKLNKEDISQWINKKELMIKAVEQLKKDLSPYGDSISFDVNNRGSFEFLLDQLEDILIKIPASGLQSVFYRVDVKEKYVEKAREDGDGYQRTLARLIIWRELQKVITRLMFSSGNWSFDQ
jgi:hypothetical protein